MSDVGEPDHRSIGDVLTLLQAELGVEPGEQVRGHEHALLFSQPQRQGVALLAEADAHKPSASTRADTPKAQLKADREGGRNPI